MTDRTIQLLYALWRENVGMFNFFCRPKIGIDFTHTICSMKLQRFVCDRQLSKRYVPGQACTLHDRF